MTSTEMPRDARAFDDLDNNGFLRITNCLSIILSRGDLELVTDIADRTVTVKYRTGAVNKLGHGHVVLRFPSEVLQSDILEDFEVTVDKDIVILIERQYSSAATFQRIAGVIEGLMYKL
ncbi:hypothetical protein pEaSNUABM30_00258 [Erwinia phage pEa_SNUABM_30]|uniref:Uncharacterized protein n=1 Tax=Erwinia phage pEa_SNUABM_30 TaxID=2869553 RepID=A0AAE8XMV0_9CAUD|nr:hypothetical protein MPK69_gp258 [Erwinia phage pEa_SNUABM_30]UAW53376.1 hypothetical protein pEaSNUABM30_00258 [Erwinia phage pEa_SNUABM_30]